MRRYTHLGFCDIIAQVCASIHMNVDRHAKQNPKCRYLIQKYIRHKQPPKWKSSAYFPACLPICFWIQHSIKPLFAKFGSFRRKWRSISHIRYIISGNGVRYLPQPIPTFFRTISTCDRNLDHFTGRLRCVKDQFRSVKNDHVKFTPEVLNKNTKITPHGLIPSTW